MKTKNKWDGNCFEVGGGKKKEKDRQKRGGDEKKKREAKKWYIGYGGERKIRGNGRHKKCEERGKLNLKGKGSGRESG